MRPHAGAVNVMGFPLNLPNGISFPLNLSQKQVPQSPLPRPVEALATVAQSLSDSNNTDHGVVGQAFGFLDRPLNRKASRTDSQDVVTQ